MRKQQNFQWKEMTMGTCYYPEHWSRELWQDDLQRMKAAGITVIRVAEFAWNKVEPEEGVFTFDFWDEFMELCKQEEMPGWTRWESCGDSGAGRSWRPLPRRI